MCERVGGAVCEIVILINLPDVAFFWVNDNPEFYSLLQQSFYHCVSF